jgi:ATP-dependent Clp protease ATP-binding subunit ClpC
VDIFDRLSDEAREALISGREQAQRLNHRCFATEHLLLGILSQPNCTAARILRGMGVDESRVRSAVEFILGPSQPNGTGAYEPTPRLLTVIELAGDEAQRLRQREIGSEHLLLGLLREGAGVAVFILDTLGVNLEKARMRLLGSSDPST